METDGTDPYVIDDDLARFDLDLVHRWLSTEAYWSLGRTREQVGTAASNSVNLGAFTADGTQVAYARIVTDHATFAWVADVFVDTAHRGRGLGSRLAEEVVARLRPLGLTRAMLATQDAHDVYARVGFVPVPHPERLMVLGPAAPTDAG